MPRADRAIALLVLANAFVGAMVGAERTTLPLLAEREFGLASAAAALAFIATFGASKAATNLAAGALADRHGRKRVLVLGWLLALPVPVAVALAPSWGWIVAANALLGVSQGLTWSMTLNMKLDLADPARRGRVVGWNEAAGYGGLSVAAAVTGYLAATLGLRGAPALVGIVLALAGLAVALATRETAPRGALAPVRLGAAFAAGSGGDLRRTVASAAGLATNLKDGALWGLMPAVLLARGLDLAAVGVVVAAYPAAWAVAQLATGPLADRVGAGRLVAPGLLLQAAGVAGLAWAAGVPGAAAAAVVAGLGTALAYPALIAFVAREADDASRASAVGVYRFWRDLGYAAGALGAGLVADAWGAPSTMVATAGVVGAVAVASLTLARG